MIMRLNKAKLNRTKPPQIIRNRIKKYKVWSYYFIDWTPNQFNEEGD